MPYRSVRLFALPGSNCGHAEVQGQISHNNPSTANVATALWS